MRAPALALAVRSHHLCAVTLEHGLLTGHWAATRPFTSLTELEDAAAGLLRDAVRHLGRSPSGILLSVGPTFSRLKRVVCVPSVVSDADLSAILSENLSRFFLGAAARWSLLGWYRDEGQLWVGVVDPQVVDAVVAAGHRIGVPVRTCVLAICAVAAVSPSGAHEWSDGSQAYAIVVRNGRVARIQALRQVSADLDGTAGRAMDDLLGVEEAVAVGAPSRFPARERRRARWERIVRAAAIATAALFAGLAAFGPFAWHTARARSASAARLVIADSVEHVIRVESAAREDREDFEAIMSFLASSSERRRTLLAFTEALPAGAALAALRVDATGVTATVVAPESVDILDAFARSPGLQGVVPLGGMSSEANNGARFQRVVVTARRASEDEGSHEP